ncbi:hypothetical protein DKX38_004377 [Salix brachista]|uniref:WIYLD domain-containing protein n=1 Tax=Salix brachista TaxID=2182728 RepID=A0A5N5NCH4_9ROSI|nr:hypothetical protein DKX38_004377 [Salix brachista]
MAGDERRGLFGVEVKREERSLRLDEEKETAVVIYGEEEDEGALPACWLTYKVHHQKRDTERKEVSDMHPHGPRSTGRRRKRLTRMDAAVDAMRSYGFSDGLIVSTVKGLLKVGPMTQLCPAVILMQVGATRGLGNKDTCRPMTGYGFKVPPGFHFISLMNVEFTKKVFQSVVDRGSRTKLDLM